MISARLRPGAVLHRSAALALAALGLCCCLDAQAVLGGAADSVHADQMRFQGVRRQSIDWQMTTHEISLNDGSRIKEYVNASGQVFAVSWRTRLKPDLAALLGAHYAVVPTQRSAAVGVAQARRQQSVRRPELVLHQSGRMSAFSGLAYVPTLVPQGLDADALR